MINKDYDGTKIEPAIGLLPSLKCRVIRITRERMWMQVTDRTETAESTLQTNLLSQTICPPKFIFNDVPEVRRILGISPNAPDTFSEKDFGPKKS